MSRKRPIDLARVRATLARLDATIAAHPELTEPRARARLATWLDTNTNDEGEMVNKRSDEERLTVPLGIRLSTEDAARLEALTERVRVASKHSIARAALLLGLAALEADPTRLFAPELAAPKPAKPKRTTTKKR